MATLKFSLAQLAEELKAEFRGDPHCEVSSLATLESAQPGSLSFLGNAKYKDQLKNTKASIVIVPKAQLNDCPTNALIFDNIYYALSVISKKFDQRPTPKPGVHPSAIIGDGCQIKISTSVGPNVVLGDNVSLGARVRLEPGVVLGDGVSIGDDTHIYQNVSIYHGVTIGQRCIIHSGVVIGADGFGMAPHQGRWFKIHQLGGVVIGDDVEVGANTTIDRAAIENTVIGDGVKLDNHIQIGHNTHIGAHTVIAGCTAIAGSVKIGKHCVIGGSVGIAGHLSIADGVNLAGGATVLSSIEKSGVYSCSVFPCQERIGWLRTVAQVQKLTGLNKRVKTLEKKADIEEGL